MSLVARLKADHQAARVAAMRGGDKELPALLGTLIGDLVAEARADVNREPTDAEATAKVLKYVANARTNLAASAGRPEAAAKYQAEIDALVPYGPPVPDESEVTAAIAAYRAENPGANVGATMRHLRERFGAGLDGKRAAELAKAA